MTRPAVPPDATVDGSDDRRAPIAALTFALAVAAALRLFDLDRLPGGLHFDLGANLLDVADILDRGTRSVYFTRNNGREPLIVYMQAVSAAAIGLTPFAA
ncbi:MAG: hypothetical protein EPO26_11130 [Chloroflexota bacterium]|nr:MAG: hypothetical protein EPO26_11130 [Chloroflexota bacterium]